jgi:hypothetical protein
MTEQRRRAGIVSAPSPEQALAIAVQLCCVAQFIGLAELALARRELTRGGFLDWSIMGATGRCARTRIGKFIERGFRRLPLTVFIVLLAADAAVLVSLMVSPSQPFLLACAATVQITVLKRHWLTFDGSDQMVVVILIACFLGCAVHGHVTARAACSFVAGEVALAYLVAGAYKIRGPLWRSGQAFSLITRTKVFGHPAVARVVHRHPMLGFVATYCVVCWELIFPLALIAPLAVLVTILVIGVVFHVACAVVMGLNRFVWVFVATYPAVIGSNAAIRAGIGRNDANVVTVAVLAAAAVVLAVTFAQSASPAPS